MCNLTGQLVLIYNGTKRETLDHLSQTIEKVMQLSRRNKQSIRERKCTLFNIAKRDSDSDLDILKINKIQKKRATIFEKVSKDERQKC